MPRFLHLAAAAAAALLAATLSHAAPAERRLQLEIDFLREGTLDGNVERGKARLQQTVRLQVVLSSDGTPGPFNPLDPESGQRLAAQGQRTVQKVQAAQRQHGSAAADPQAMLAMQARVQQMQARCGQDRDCLMREATAWSATQVAGGNLQVQGRLQAYGHAVQACERQHAAQAARSAREACIAQARRAAGGADESDAEDEAPAPYLHFSGSPTCQLDDHVRIEERVEGSFDDVQGRVPFTSTTQAEARTRDPVHCPLLQAVLDTRNGRLWTHLHPGLRGAKGETVRTEKGRSPQRSQGETPLRWHEAADWLNGRLLDLGSEGSDRFERAVPGGRIEVKMRWRFAPA